MTSKRKDQICALLKSIETGEPEPIAVVNQNKYIQHNPHTHEGSEGLEVLFQQISKTSPRVNIVRVFEDGDYVFAHTEYDFSTSNVGFEVFRFEGDQVVEHWDNIQPRQERPGQSGLNMTDGPTAATDHAHTETNRQLVQTFVEDVLIRRQIEQLERYLDSGSFTQHSPRIADGLPALRSALEARSNSGFRMDYHHIHRTLAEGNFVLTVSEGTLDGIHTSFYDLFRVHDGKLVEHWDTVEAIPPRSEWKNDNGKF